MLCVQTQKGGYLVKVNVVYGCYTDSEGNFLRSVAEITLELEWAKKTWKSYEETEFPEELEQQLLKCLQYVGEYKDSLVEE